MSFNDPFESSNVNLSTSTATSSTALLSSVRAERQAREEKRRYDHAARKIQRVWRGRSQAAKTRLWVLEEMESGGLGDWRRQASGLVILSNGGGSEEATLNRRKREVLVRCCRAGLNQQGQLTDPLKTDPSWGFVLSVIFVQILRTIKSDPLSPDTLVLLDTLESILNPQSWSHIDEQSRTSAQTTLVHSLAESGYIVTLVEILDKLIAASLPKKKHPHLVPLTRLLTAPYRFGPRIPESLHEQSLHTLLAVPALPTSLPLPSLSHLSANLPLFPTLIPLGASRPELLDRGRLSTEQGKTYFLANLATFGITGGMLARYGAKGASDWIKVIGTVLVNTKEGWGKWADGLVEEEEIMPQISAPVDDSDEEAAPVAGPSRIRAITRRPPIQPAVQKKVVLLASAAHVNSLSDLLLASSAPSSGLIDFCRFALALLGAFKGSPKWESILEAVLLGSRGKGLEKRIWREGVRGKWADSGDRSGWDLFSENPSTPCLLFLTQLYNHYLLITPDDEFFDTKTSNPFSLDEVMELAGIWRDLSYHAYLNGVAPRGKKPVKGFGTEEERSMLTRAVTRVAERNARRKFIPDDFWVMVHDDLKGFVQAAVYEDAELTNPEEEVEDATARLPSWARARQRFSKRQLAYISPRLGLLNNLPMTVPFTTRLEIFRNSIEMDRDRFNATGGEGHRLKAKIRRNRLAEDGFDALADAGPALKGSVYIKFYDQFGEREAGIDGGGLFKEFLTSLSKEVFDTNRGLWLSTNENQLYPNPHSYASESHQLNWYAFIGRILGKALYEGILVDVSFAGFFLAKWLGKQSYLDDLNTLDRDLYKGLIMLKNYPRPEELALNFTITEEDFGVTKTIDLIPGGSEIPVTVSNRHEYIQLVCRHKLDRQIAAQSRAFFSGLSDIIDSKWLRMFDQQELRQIIGGEETPIDLEDLKAHCEVNGFPTDDTMRMFWKVVKSFNQEQQRALLRFVTSCSRPPLLGFAHLNPKFGIKFNGTDTDRLPSASACFNLLKLPGYKDEVSLKRKLLQAITSGAGFDLS